MEPPFKKFWLRPCVVYCSIYCTLLCVLYQCTLLCTSVHCMYQCGFFVCSKFLLVEYSCPVNNSYSAATTLLYVIIVYVVHHYKHITLLIVGIIQATHIPQVKATCFNQVLNIFYYPYTDKASDTNSVYFGQGLVVPLNHQRWKLMETPL